MRARIMVTWLLMTAGCTGAEAGPDAGMDAAPVAQGGPARGDLVINEVMPRPATGPDGPDWPDWIELVNRAPTAVDLCDYFITDSLDRLDHYAALGGAVPPAPCAPVMLDPGDYLILYADDDPAAGTGHLPFKLGEADEVHLVSIQGIPMDSLIYLYPRGSAGASLARLPDGEGLFFVTEPSPGAANPEMTP